MSFQLGEYEVEENYTSRMGKLGHTVKLSTILPSGELFAVMSYGETYNHALGKASIKFEKELGIYDEYEFLNMKGVI